MKWMYFFPLTFFSGIEGFGLFAAYLAVVVSIYLFVRKVRENREPLAEPALNDVPVVA